MHFPEKWKGSSGNTEAGLLGRDMLYQVLSPVRGNSPVCLNSAQASLYVQDITEEFVKVCLQQEEIPDGQGRLSSSVYI